MFLICIPVNVNVMAVAPGTKDPVLVSEVSVSTLLEMAPVNNAAPIMKASGTPASGIFTPEAGNKSDLANVMSIVPPGATVAKELNVMTKFRQAVALDAQVGNDTAVTWYPEMGPLEPVAAMVSAVVTTLMPASLPPVAVFPKETPLNVRVITVFAGIAADPSNLKDPLGASANGVKV